MPVACPPGAWSREVATAYVVAALETKGSASRDDFDVESIVDVSRVVADSWDFTTIDDEIFWRIASRFLRD
ncbi:MAG: hypothetical protein HOQ24_07535 [Mycobacteriaceae bacterium]|nr:hypothetical protein [Mycobacteriaceae bacterium]